MYCWKCGTKNDDNNYKCTKCGALLHDVDKKAAPGTHGTAQAPPAQATSSGDNTLGGLIPTKNAPALTAYYMGIFCIVPFLGLLLVLPAIILGIVGVSKADKVPTAKGKIHAWVGIILGAASGLGHFLTFNFLFR